MYVRKENLNLPHESNYQMLIKDIFSGYKLSYYTFDDYNLGNYFNFEVGDFYDEEDEGESAFDLMVERMGEVEEEYKSFNWEVKTIRENDDEFHFIAYHPSMTNIIDLILKHIK